MLQVAAYTDVGLVRKNNEDACYTGCPLGGLEDNLFIVADGMGGHKGGHFASHFVVHKIPELLPGRNREYGILPALRESIDRTNKALYQIAQDREDLEGMGSTLVMAWFDKKEWIIINVGDSRAYLFFEDELVQITRDHSLVEEMVRQNRLTKEDPMYAAHKHVITRAMGTEALVEEDCFILPAETGQRLLLCSDGLHGMVPDEEIAQVLREEAEGQRAAARLLAMAKDAGGRDNITILLIDYRDEKQ
ncbi:MAG: Stp1/IreP family PP2C-type Ser/Thr phosphatase [Lachnospiraceae bacterium]|nr:Stp1/IreP family PP2C-type Ser/Thr phosphatase [Lachnospiraceae bacterium]